jgi:hypothetical protein
VRVCAEISSGCRQKASANSPFYKKIKIDSNFDDFRKLLNKKWLESELKIYGGLYAWTLILKFWNI